MYLIFRQVLVYNEKEENMTLQEYHNKLVEERKNANHPKLKELLPLIAISDPISILFEDSCYENYKWVHEIPRRYYNYEVWGIGVITSESAINKEIITFSPHLELLIKKPKEEI